MGRGAPRSLPRGGTGRPSLGLEETLRSVVIPSPSSLLRCLRFCTSVTLYSTGRNLTRQETLLAEREDLMTRTNTL